MFSKNLRGAWPGNDFSSLLDGSLAAFRQAAADYPSVSNRMIDNLARLFAATGPFEMPQTNGTAG